MRLLKLALLLLLPVIPPLQAQEILIGTGSKSGVYFQVGRALCRLVEQNMGDLSCRPLETPGSLSNLANVEGGSLEIGIVQSDIQHHAVNRSGPFQFVDTPHANLRSLFSLYFEPFTLIARRDAGINSLSDLKGKRINIGNLGSGQRATMEVVMRAKGWDRGTFQLATELPASNFGRSSSILTGNLPSTASENCCANSGKACAYFLNFLFQAASAFFPFRSRYFSLPGRFPGDGSHII